MDNTEQYGEQQLGSFLKNSGNSLRYFTTVRDVCRAVRVVKPITQGVASPGGRVWDAVVIRNAGLTDAVKRAEDRHGTEE
ncbi:hypothetical protein [Haloechinothrix halophila]|uniref:hypothetical protein n=1 Tax=Haloechinothrix halophila TaxID=1069073 RepID=UPI0012FCF680|nr:hypothetical protein [Haloechinothrix halophila]